MTGNISNQLMVRVYFQNAVIITKTSDEESCSVIPQKNIHKATFYLILLIEPFSKT